MPLPLQGSLLIRYLISQPSGPATSKAVLDAEQTAHGDLLLTGSFPDAPWACAVRVFWLLERLASQEPLPDFVGTADDDIFLHPVRVVRDLSQWARSGNDRGLVYANMVFSAGWSDARMESYGYGTYEEHFPRLLATWKRAVRKGDGGLGPFPVPMGAFTLFDRGLALRIATAPSTRELIDRLTNHHAASYVHPDKCMPFSDGAVGWALAQLREPVTWLNILTERMHYWRGALTHLFLRDQLAVLHGAHEWVEHFQWALCGAMRQFNESYLATLDAIASCDRSCRQAKKRARGRAIAEALLPGGEMATRSASRARVQQLVRAQHLDSELGWSCRGIDVAHGGCNVSDRCSATRATFLEGSCRADADCTAYFGRIFGSWVFCSHVPVAQAPTPAVTLEDTSVCRATEAEMLASCTSGFQPTRELRLEGALWRRPVMSDDTGHTRTEL